MSSADGWATVQVGTALKERPLTPKLTAGRPGQPALAELVALGVPVTIIIDQQRPALFISAGREGRRDKQSRSQALE